MVVFAGAVRGLLAATEAAAEDAVRRRSESNTNTAARPPVRKSEDSLRPAGFEQLVQDAQAGRGAAKRGTLEAADVGGGEGGCASEVDERSCPERTWPGLPISSEQRRTARPRSPRETAVVEAPLQRVESTRATRAAGGRDRCARARRGIHGLRENEARSISRQIARSGLPLTRPRRPGRSSAARSGGQVFLSSRAVATRLRASGRCDCRDCARGLLTRPSATDGVIDIPPPPPPLPKLGDESEPPAAPSFVAFKARTLDGCGRVRRLVDGGERRGAASEATTAGRPGTAAASAS